MKRFFIVVIMIVIGLTVNGYAAPILFDFESAPVADSGDGANPTFTKDGLTISFSTDSAIDPAGIAQWTNDARAIPTYDGIGDMRLSAAEMGGTHLVGAWLDFSTDISSVEFYAYRYDTSSTSSSSYTDPFIIEAYSSSNVLLDSKSTLSSSYELIQFSGIGSIGRLHFTGLTNVPRFDHMTITTIPEPVTMFMLGSGLLGLAGFRKKFKK